ncbi:hypothetical protein H9Q13_03210 [Pontibacter sp. JH31]|uniref:Uncharacterized protein n=1 Tax=Pontibacter aquaedesilientis TaxID=2766980 RepID=A0ABR7XCY8_9BACT|nr:hypothetical protein [Pontibacter aquaedesilientis]MBD1396162.1 hypothetical protein [Pontibacter aquaedesilientis]
MELTLKIRLLLLALYEFKYNGKLYELGELFSKSGVKISRIEIEEIARTLSEDGLLKTITVKETIYGQISVDGVEFLEENKFFSGSSYLPKDRIKPLEREILRNKLNELYTAVLQTELASEVPSEVLEREVEELKALLNLLGRHSWLQILKGKFLEIAAEKLPHTELSELLQDFELSSGKGGDVSNKSTN